MASDPTAGGAPAEMPVEPDDNLEIPAKPEGELQQLQDRLSRIEALLFSRQALRDNATESGTTVSARSRRWP